LGGIETLTQSGQKWAIHSVHLPKFILYSEGGDMVEVRLTFMQ
jgi:hypothetical protein